jgi:hypothetical protein
MLVSHVREEHRLRVLENRVLRKIFGPGREEVTGGWRKVSMEKLHDLYTLPDVVIGNRINEDEIVWDCDKYVGERKCLHSFGGENNEQND